MLDTIFGNPGDRKQAKSDMHALLLQARNEREALRALLAQANSAVATMVGPGRNGHAAPGPSAADNARIDHLEAQVADLHQQLSQALALVQANASPAVQASSQKSQQALHDEALALLDRTAQEACTRVESLRMNALQDIDTRVAGLAQLPGLCQDTEKRLTSLNALAEHVTLKTKALDTQRQAVEHAVVEATRLNEMVWAMDAQIAKLADGRDQMQRAEDAVARMEELARGVSRDVAAAEHTREQFLQDAARQDAQARALADAMRGAIERLALDRQELGAFDERLKALSTALADTEHRVQAVTEQNPALQALQQQAQTLGKAYAVLSADAEALAQRQSALNGLADQLQQIEALGLRTAAQQQGLLQSQQDLDDARCGLAEFHAAHAESVQLRQQLAQDRQALEGFVERTAGMLARAPALQARMDAVLGQMDRVEQGSQTALRLADVAAELDTQLTRLQDRQQLVQVLEQRVNSLHGLTADVDRTLHEQLARHAELQGLKHQCDTLATQVADAQHKLEGVAALQGRLQPVAEQVAALQQTLQASHQMVAAMQLDEAEVLNQQAHFAELVEQGRQQAAQTADRLQQVRAANDELAQASQLKQSLLVELAQVQARQQDAVAQIQVTEDQLHRAQGLAAQLEQRRGQLLGTDRTMAALEGRLGELGRSAQAVEQQMQTLAERQTLVLAVKSEVDQIRQISSSSRADLQFVAEHRSAVAEVRSQVEAVLAGAADTQARIEHIEARRKTVQEVQASASAVTHMLGDIHLNLEVLSEQRAVIDHVGEQLARLDFTVQEANNTLRALQREREVAERIEQGIKLLRTRGGPAAAA